MLRQLRRVILQNSTLLLLLLLLFNFGVMGYFIFTFMGKSEAELPVKKTLLSPEISAIVATTDQKIQTEAYMKLLNRVGPAEAQEQLYHSGLPFDGQSHLLNHEAGEWLYEKYGTKGLTYCKDYFLSSCYHGFLIEFIADKGLQSLPDVMKACWQVGTATATQCAHAIGHGVLAWEGYKNLPQALKDCDRVEATSSKFPTYNCYDGAFMENNWAVHDDGTPSEDRWFKESDPTYPCYDGQIAEKYRRACWSNQPQVMYKMFKGDIDKVAKECETIKAKDYQDTCFDSLARQINPVTQGNAQMVFDLCNKMPVGWKSKCVDSNVSAFFSVGDREIPFVLCERIPESGRAGCYEVLQQRISSYIPTLSERISMCSRIPEHYLTTYCPTQ